MQSLRTHVAFLHGFSASLLLNFIAFIPPPSPFYFAPPRYSILSSSSPLSAASAFLSLSLIDPIAFLSSAAARACVCSRRTLSFHFASFFSLPCTRFATATVTSSHSLEEQVAIVGIPLAFSAFLIGAPLSLHRRSIKCACTLATVLLNLVLFLQARHRRSASSLPRLRFLLVSFFCQHVRVVCATFYFIFRVFVLCDHK